MVLPGGSASPSVTLAIAPAQTTVTSAPSTRTDRTAAPSASGSVASTITTSSARPPARTSWASSLGGNDRQRPSGACLPGSREAQGTALAGPTQHGDGGSARPRMLTDHSRGQGRGAADVGHSHREILGQILGQPHHHGPREEDRVAVAGDLFAAAVPSRESVVQQQRREGQRDERRDPVADPQPQGRLSAHLVHDAGEHPARAGDRVLHLAPRGDDFCHLGLHGRPVPGMRQRELPERGGVEVQPSDSDRDLVGSDRRRRVESPGGLRQHADRFENPVRADRSTQRLHHRPPPHVRQTGRCPVPHL